MSCLLNACIFLAALLWLLAPGPGAGPHAAPASADAPDLLAEGPEPIVVSIASASGEREDRGTLCFLKKDTLYYRSERTGKVSILPAKRIAWVETADKKYRWTTDEGKGVFVGPVKLPAPIDLSPLPMTGRKEGVLFFAALEQLHRDVDSLAGVNEESLANCQTTVSLFKKYAQSRGLDSALVDLCDGLVKMIEKRRSYRETIARISEEVSKKKLDLNRELARSQVLVTLKTASELETIDSYETLLVNRYLASGRTLHQKAALAQAFKFLGADVERKAQERLDKARQEYEDVREGQFKLLRSLGPRFGQRSPEDFSQQDQELWKLTQQRDWEGISRLMGKIAESEPDNPFCKAEYLMCASKVPGLNNKERAKKVAEMADDCVQASRAFPGEPVYQHARLTILTSACLMACLASELELTGESWCEGYSALAARATRLIDATLALPGNSESSRLLREKRAWSLMQSGHLEEALDQALKLESNLDRGPEFGFNLARLYSYRKETRQAMTWLEKAVREDKFTRIQAMRTDPELREVRVRQRGAFETLLRPAFAIDIVQKGPGGRSFRAAEDAQLTNHSAFPCTNLTVKIGVLTRTRQVGVLTYAKTIERIDPGESVVLEGILKSVPNARITGVDVTCDQNRRR